MTRELLFYWFYWLYSSTALRSTVMFVFMQRSLPKFFLLVSFRFVSAAAKKFAC